MWVLNSRFSWASLNNQFKLCSIKFLELLWCRLPTETMPSKLRRFGKLGFTTQKCSLTLNGFGGFLMLF